MHSVQTKPFGPQRSARIATGGIVIAATGMSFAGMVLLAWRLSVSERGPGPLGTPTITVVIAAAVVLGLVLAGAIVLEAISLIPLLCRSILPDTRSELVSPVTGGNTDRTARLTVMIPAHNEESTLPATLAALKGQSRTPDGVLVIADKCIDQTVKVARGAGCAVIESHRNTGRKAGALNQGFSILLPGQDDDDLVLVMDADTRLSSNFIRDAISILDEDPGVSAVGGVFMGDSRREVLAQLQRNEFVRYARQLASRRGRVFVLTGTATVFRASALKEVQTMRGSSLPGARGMVYAESAITEDNEITLAVKSLGAYIVSPSGCQVTTETMPSLRTLWTQRLRWQRGALENLADYGMRSSTARYWLQQWGLAYGSIALPLSLLGILIIPILAGQLAFVPFWGLVTIAFSLERGLSAWQAGWNGRLLAFSLLPEIVYSLILQACFLRALVAMMASEPATWGHLPPEPAGATG